MSLFESSGGSDRDGADSPVPTGAAIPSCGVDGEAGADLDSWDDFAVDSWIIGFIDPWASVLHAIAWGRPESAERNERT